MFQHLRNDIPAGIVVFFVAVPLCLGIALASGAPLFAGLIAGIVGGILVGALSGSQAGVSGPAAGLAVIVLAAIQDLGYEAFLMAVVLAGIIQIAMGMGRAGFVAYFFPSAVIKGMLSGIGIIIVLKQIPHALGHDSDPEGQLSFAQPDGETTFSALTRMLEDFQLGAIVISLVSLAILVFWETVLMKRSRIFQLIQGPLVVVAFGIAFQLVASQWMPALALDPSHLVTVPIASTFDEVVNLFTFPDWSSIFTGAVWVTAITMAVVASLETLLCVEATDKLDEQKRVTPTNRELLAQGAGNMVSGAIGGLPITQVIVRSSANIQSGARTKMSAIVHGVLLLGFVALLPGLLNLIPLAALASILFVVGYKLAKPSLFKQIYASGMDQFVPFVVTIAGIVFTDLLLGICLGLVCAVFMILRRNFIGAFDFHIRDVEAADHSHHVTIRLNDEVSFLARASMVSALGSIPDGAHVVIDETDNVHMDPDVREVLEEFKATARFRSITVEERRPATQDQPREKTGHFAPDSGSDSPLPQPA